MATDSVRLTPAELVAGCTEKCDPHDSAHGWLHLYRPVSLPAATWWERGFIRYGVLSYSLWLRHIYWDLRGVRPPKRGKALDPRLHWIERNWQWLSTRTDKEWVK